MADDIDITPVSKGGEALTAVEAGRLIGRTRKAIQEAPPPEEEVLDDDAEEAESEYLEESEESEVEDPAEPEETPITSINDLANASGIDAEDLAELEIALPSGKSVQLKELQQGYLRQSDHTRKSQELAQKRRDDDARTAEQQQKQQAQSVQLAQMLQQGKQLLMGEVNSAEMQQLRVSNPAEYAARSIGYQQRMGAVDQLFNTAADQYDRYQATQTEQQQNKAREYAAAELEKLQVAIPDLQPTLGKISSFLSTEMGFTDEELNAVVDSRLVLLADDARKYRELQKAGAKTKKRVAKVPKPIRSSVKPKAAPGQKSQEAAIKKLKQSGSARDAGELLKLLRSK